MEWINLFFSVLGSLIAAVAAYFSFPQFRKMQPVISVFITDIPQCDSWGSKAERMQQDGYFILHIKISRIDAPINFNRLTVKNAMVPAQVVDEIGDFAAPYDPHDMVRNSVPFCRRVTRDEEFSILVRPLPPRSETGVLLVTLRYGFLLRASAKCKYARTHFFGE